jgi:hypothetical protein
MALEAYRQTAKGDLRIAREKGLKVPSKYLEQLLEDPIRAR